MNYPTLIEKIKTDPRTLDEISPREFEELIGELLGSLGWQINLTSQTRDGGYDIFAKSKDLVDIETTWVIEVKKYKEDKKIGISHIRQLYSIKNYLNVSQALLVTSSSFTTLAREFEKAKYDISLADRAKILDWVNLYNPPPKSAPSYVEKQEFYSCFISYSHQDEKFAHKLNNTLRKNNIHVWYAPEELKPGIKIHEEIDKAIRLFDKLLIVLSDSSMQSDWVKTEIRKAHKKELRDGTQILFPISIVDFSKIKEWELFDSDTGKDLAVELREYLIPDFSNWNDCSSFDESFKELKFGLEQSNISKPHSNNLIEDHSGYDWYDEIGYEDFSQIRKGVKVLYEEHALFPDIDEEYYKKLRKIKIPIEVYKKSIRGFIKIDKSDDFWIDPRNRDRRIYSTTVFKVTKYGELQFTGSGNPIVSRRCIVDILDD